MQHSGNKTASQNETTRRTFLKRSATTAVTGALAANFALSAQAYAGGDETLRVGLVGCGGRGTGAAVQALTADKNAKLVAMGDAFGDRLESSLARLKKAQGAQIDVNKDHQFVGFDAYKKVIDSVDVVLLTTPPHFRPMQLKYAVEQGKHTFVEKPVAVDAPGVRDVLLSAKLAKQKGLSLVSGLCYRYEEKKRQTIQRIHDGEIGDIVSMQCSYNTRGLWMHARKPEWSDMEWQMRNWLYFTWLSGDHIAEQHIHSLDKLAWVMNNEYPVKASGTGGRQTRTGKNYGHIYDHFAIEYEYANGMKAFSRCRQQNGTQPDVSDYIYGTKGKATLMKHAIIDSAGKTKWRFKGKSLNMYQQEHNELFASIRNGKPINNGEYMVNSTMMAILGRMAAYTGKTITWEKAWNSKENLSPKKYTWGDMPIP
ncbi:Myo-inositol 2-dehydrogenase, partial [hydrothermal vent metagenome]